VAITNVFLLVMVVLAFLSIEVKKLETAVIYLGIFSLLNAIAYLFYGAPDVSLAEAVIGSTLATVLYLIAIKKYNPLRSESSDECSLRSFRNRFARYREVFWGGMCFLVGFWALRMYLDTMEDVGKPAWDYSVRFFISDTGASNAVTAIYLNYRVFDTLFEALLLLVGVVAVIYFSWRDRE